MFDKQYKQLHKNEGDHMESEKILKTQNEILWAQIFNSTIQSSAWFKDQSISPGRWAAGYPLRNTATS